MTEFVTHDVKRFIIEKPKNYIFKPGQATEVAIKQEAWQKEKRPFTFTSLNEDQVLEFTIKSYPTKKYPDHEGVTEQLHTLKPGDKLILEEPWGTINYQGSGIFIAGGAGITPFIAIIRDLKNRHKIKGNRLFFSNKKAHDVILEKEFRNTFSSEDLLLTLTKETQTGYYAGRIDKNFLNKHVKNFKQNFYVCGPSAMVQDLKNILKKLGAKVDTIVFEK